jgi:NADH-quinone oxidoreductase subunit C
LSTSPSDAAAENAALLALLAAAFPDVDLRAVDPGVPGIVVPAEHLVAVCEHLKTSPGLEFDYLASVTAIDYLDRVDVVYQMRSLARWRDCTLRIEIDRDESVAPSVTSVWRAANYQEREIYDLMGVRFTGHPDLRRILLYDEFDGHPLRKDWRLPAEPRSIRGD